eukprot:COSAG06_NODE_6233_length_3026_cov_5.655620_4_plen_354_part_00
MNDDQCHGALVCTDESWNPAMAPEIFCRCPQGMEWNSRDYACEDNRRCICPPDANGNSDHCGPGMGWGMAYCLEGQGQGGDTDGNGVADEAECANMAGDGCVWGAAFGASCAADGDCAGDLVCTAGSCACDVGSTYDSGSEACLADTPPPPPPAEYGDGCAIDGDCAGDLVCTAGSCACDVGSTYDSGSGACLDPVVCTVPSDTTGYTVTNNELNVATGFDVTAACATGYEGSSPAAAACTTSGDYTLSGCIAVVAPAPTTCIFVDVVQDGDIDYAADSADMVQAHVCKDQIGEAPIEVKSTCSDSQVCLFSELIDCCVTSPNGVNGDCDGMLATCQAVANTMRDTSCGGEGR